MRWFDVKYSNNEDWHEWIKMHVACGVKTHIVTGVELTSARTIRRTSNRYLNRPQRAGFNIVEVSADKGYISGDNLQAVVDQGATPFIPVKTNVTGKRGSELWKKFFSLLQLQARRIPNALSQAQQRGNSLQHD